MHDHLLSLFFLNVLDSTHTTPNREDAPVSAELVAGETLEKDRGGGRANKKMASADEWIYSLDYFFCTQIIHTQSNPLSAPLLSSDDSNATWPSQAKTSESFAYGFGYPVIQLVVKACQ
jgi:hypothetical protein